MIKHLLYVPFSGLGIRKGFRGDRWLRNRIRVFHRFVIPSLLNQTCQDFIVWISWRPEEKSNPIVQEFKRSLESLRGLAVVFTYGGVCFYDDKYPMLEAKDRLLNNLQVTLPELKGIIGDAEWVYMTIQPSDDMYISDAIETMQKVQPESMRAVGFRKGYIMNYATKEIAEYNPTTLPPFYTIIFPSETFLNPFTHLIYTGPYASHEYVEKRFKFLTIESRGFVVGTHGENISTTYNHPFKGRVLTNDEKDAILIKTGTYFSDPVIITRGARLLARQILNILPFQNKIRNLYHHLPNAIQFF